jgi:hypothetical protein
MSRSPEHQWSEKEPGYHAMDREGQTVKDRRKRKRLAKIDNAIAMPSTLILRPPLERRGRREEPSLWLGSMGWYGTCTRIQRNAPFGRIPFDMFPYRTRCRKALPLQAIGVLEANE